MMGSLQFHPLFPWPVLLVSTVLVLAFLIVLEWRRRNKYFVGTILLNIVLVTALLGLAARPYFMNQVPGEAIILVTHNVDEEVVDSLSTALASPQVFHHAEAKPFRKSSLLESYDQLYGRAVYVVCDGIPQYDLDKIRASGFQYVPHGKSVGIQSLLMEAPFTVNRTGNIAGTIYNDVATTNLHLKGPAGVLDSVHYSKSGIGNFEFNIRSKVKGYFVYQLEHKDSMGNVLFSEPLPVSVLQERKLNILLLQDFPTVELRFLKNFLGEKGHSIAIRYGISKDIDRSEFVNRNSESLDRISSALLKQFDLLVLSAGAYDNLSPSTQRILEQSIVEGLGLILLLDGDPSTRVKNLLEMEFLKSDQDTVQMNVAGEGKFTFPVASVKAVQHDGITSILSTGTNMLEGFVSKGKGKVGFQLVHETYPLLLSESKSAYAHVWSPLLEQVARKELVGNQLKIITPFPWYEDEPLEVQLISSQLNPLLKTNGIRTPLIEDPRMDGIWTTTVWPQHSGWNELSVEGDSIALNFYVAKNEEWKSLRTVNQVAQNKLYNVSAQGDSMDNRIREDEISPLLFFLIFLFAAGALWLLPKL